MNIITESTSKKMWISFEYKDVTYYYRFKYGRSYSNVEKYFKHDKNQFSIVTAGDFRIISKRIDKMNKKNRDIIYTSGWIITKLNPASNEYKKKIKSIKSSIKKKKSVAKDRNANVDQKIEKATISNVKAEITESGNNLIVNYKDNNEDKKVTFSFSKVDSDDAYEKLYSIKTELHPYTEEYFDFLKDTLDKTKYNSQQDRDSEKTRSFTTSFEPDIILGDKFPFHRRFISYLADGINLYNPDDMDNTKIEIKREIDKIEKYFKELKNKIKGEELDDDAELADDEFEAEESFKLLSDLYDKSFIDIKFKDKLTNIEEFKEFITNNVYKKLGVVAESNKKIVLEDLDKVKNNLSELIQYGGTDGGDSPVNVEFKNIDIVDNKINFIVLLKRTDDKSESLRKFILSYNDLYYNKIVGTEHEDIIESFDSFCFEDKSFMSSKFKNNNGKLDLEISWNSIKDDQYHKVSIHAHNKVFKNESGEKNKKIDVYDPIIMKINDVFKQTKSNSDNIKLLSNSYQNKNFIGHCIVKKEEKIYFYENIAYKNKKFKTRHEIPFHINTNNVNSVINRRKKIPEIETILDYLENNISISNKDINIVNVKNNINSFYNDLQIKMKNTLKDFNIDFNIKDVENKKAKAKKKIDKLEKYKIEVVK
jgi:hypothetical protein